MIKEEPHSTEALDTMVYYMYSRSKHCCCFAYRCLRCRTKPSTSPSLSVCLVSLLSLSSLPAWSLEWRSLTLWQRPPAQDYCGVLRKILVHTDVMMTSHPFSLSLSLSLPPSLPFSLPPSLCSQIMGILLVFISSSVLATPLPQYLLQVNQCGSTAVSHHSGNTSTLPSCFQVSRNSSVPSKLTESDELIEQQHGVWFFAILISVIFVFFVFVFHPKYKRVESEKRASFEQSVYVGPVNR